MRATDPHQAFVSAWRAFGEQWLLGDTNLVGPPGAWFKACNGTRWWDDERLPPEKPNIPVVVKYKAPKNPKRKRVRPTRVPIPGRFAELVGWPWEKNERLAWWERWHADPRQLGLEPEPLLWWEADTYEEWDEGRKWLRVA